MISQSCAEIIACFYCILVQKYFSVKKCLVSAFWIALVGSLGIMATSSGKEVFEENWNATLNLVFIFLAKFGITVSFNFSYVILICLFKPLIRSTAYGICNISARAFTIFSPLVAVLADPIPMAFFSFGCALAGTVTLFLNLEEAEDEDNEQHKIN